MRLHQGGSELEEDRGRVPPLSRRVPGSTDMPRPAPRVTPPKLPEPVLERLRAALSSQTKPEQGPGQEQAKGKEHDGGTEQAAPLPRRRNTDDARRPPAPVAPPVMSASSLALVPNPEAMTQPIPAISRPANSDIVSPAVDLFGTKTDRATQERAIEADRAARQRAAQERAARQRAAQERAAAERAAAERAAQEREAAERAAQAEREAQQRAAAERAAARERAAQADRAAAERAARDRADAERAARDRAAAERAARDRAAAERAAQERAAHEREARERAAHEDAVNERAAAQAQRAVEAERAAETERIAEAEHEMAERAAEAERELEARAAEAERAALAERIAEAEREMAERAAEAERRRAARLHDADERDDAERDDAQRAAAELSADYVLSPEPRVPAAYPDERPITRGRGQYRRSYRGTGLLVVTLALIAAGSVVLLMSPRSGGTSPATNPKLSNGARAAEARAVSAAAAWVADQVSRAAKVSCERSTCTVLKADGEPSGSLVQLTRQTTPPLHGNVIVVTPAVRSQFGSLLATDYAPGLLATFGSGSTKVEIRVIAPNGIAAYRAALMADLADREQTGAGLLAIPEIAVSGTAKKQLAAGQVDSRLLEAIAALADEYPIHIIGFGNDAPGAGPGIPLRYAYLAETDSAAGLGRAKYIREMRRILRSSAVPYHPTHVGTIRVGDQAELRIEFPAPEPLGLLGG
jgi:hypothetical protein